MERRCIKSIPGSLKRFGRFQNLEALNRKTVASQIVISLSLWLILIRHASSRCVYQYIHGTSFIYWTKNNLPTGYSHFFLMMEKSNFLKTDAKKLVHETEEYLLTIKAIDY
nr:PREDICTED: uncharacterized protein LOC105661775 [Megachile rotundata]